MRLWVVDVDRNDLPVRLALIDQANRANHLHEGDAASALRENANLHHVQRIAITYSSESNNIAIQTPNEYLSGW